MKLAPYIERLNASKELSTFKEQNPEAFITAGFFVLDLENNQNIHQIDYFIPEKKKVAAFTLDDPEKIQLQMMDLMSDKTPEALDLQTNTDLDQLEGILEDEMKNRGDTEKIKKIIAVLQSIDGKKIWNLNCICSGMEILKAHINDADKSVLKMDKASILDFVKQVPGQKGMPQMPGAPQQQSQQPAKKEDVEKEIEKIDKLEQALEKEKQALKKVADEKEDQ